MTLYEMEKIINENNRTDFFMSVTENNPRSEHQPQYSVLLEAHSPLGEDLPEEFEVDTVEELVKEMKERADNYDSDEHAELWIDSRGKNGVPNVTIRELLDDADAIGDMYYKLAKVLEEESEI